MAQNEGRKLNINGSDHEVGQGQSSQEQQASEVLRGLNAEQLKRVLSDRERELKLDPGLDLEGGKQLPTRLTTADMLKATEGSTPKEITHPNPEEGKSWLNRLFSKDQSYDNVRVDPSTAPEIVEDLLNKDTTDKIQ